MRKVKRQSNKTSKTSKQKRWTRLLQHQLTANLPDENRNNHRRMRLPRIRRSLGCIKIIPFFHERFTRHNTISYQVHVKQLIDMQDCTIVAQEAKTHCSLRTGLDRRAESR